MPNIISAYSNTGTAPPIFGGTTRIPGFEVSSPTRSPYWNSLRSVYRTYGQPKWRVIQGAPWPARARITQYAREELLKMTPSARITQMGREAIVALNPSARITQYPREVLLILGTTFSFFPKAAQAGAVTKGPTVGIKGGAIVHPTGPSQVGAVTKPGPKWSVAIFGALALGITNTFNPNPSFDIRPGRKVVGTGRKNPWIGAPFNANDNFGSATVIPNPASIAAGTPYVIRGSTSGFTLEVGEPQPTAGKVVATGWFTFTPTVSGYYNFNLQSSLIDTVIAIYKQGGSGITGLVEVGSNDNLSPGNSTSNLAVYLTAGTQYWIQIGTGSSQTAGGIFELDVSYVSATCAPSQCGGQVTSNFWQGYGCSSSPTVVGGFGGCPEVARDRCPASWTTIHTNITCDTSNHLTDRWYVGFEIHDIHDQLLGGRGNFFTGPQAGINSWQDRVQILPGQTVNGSLNYTPGSGGDTSKAYWFVLMAFPVNGGVTYTGTFHATATFDGSCPLPSTINTGRSKSWGWVA